MPRRPAAPAALADIVATMDHPDTAAPSAGPDAKAPIVRPWWGPLAIAAFVGLVIMSNIANASWAGWINDNPERVVLFSPRLRYLVAAVAAGLDAVPYAVIATLRLGAAYAVCHLIGRAYREDILRIFTRYLGVTPEMVESMRTGLRRAEIVVVPWFVGSNLVAALTGIQQIKPLRLVTLVGVGIAGRLALMWWLAEMFESPLQRALDWVHRYDRWVIAASVVLVILLNVRNFRRGSTE